MDVDEKNIRVIARLDIKPVFNKGNKSRGIKEVSDLMNFKKIL